MTNITLHSNNIETIKQWIDEIEDNNLSIVDIAHKNTHINFSFGQYISREAERDYTYNIYYVVRGVYFEPEQFAKFKEYLREKLYG